MRAGSPELTDIFARGIIGANDTSAAVGYAPLTDTERLVLIAERYLNSHAYLTVLGISAEGGAKKPYEDK